MASALSSWTTGRSWIRIVLSSIWCQPLSSVLFYPLFKCCSCAPPTLRPCASYSISTITEGHHFWRKNGNFEAVRRFRQCSQPKRYVGWWSVDMSGTTFQKVSARGVGMSRTLSLSFLLMKVSTCTVVECPTSPLFRFEMLLLICFITSISSKSHFLDLRDMQPQIFSKIQSWNLAIDMFTRSISNLLFLLKSKHAEIISQTTFHRSLVRYILPLRKTDSLTRSKKYSETFLSFEEIFHYG